MGRREGGGCGEDPRVQTTPRYDEAAAKLSWSRTLAFFKQHLKG
jgi:dienelactone hydrolase